VSSHSFLLLLAEILRMFMGCLVEQGYGQSDQRTWAKWKQFVAYI
jgi:hypothetical protein